MFGLYPLTTQIHIAQVCADLDEDDCDSSRVSGQASTINLFASLALSAASILTCGLYGSIADIYGRKVVIITPFVGLMLYSAAYLYVDTYNPSNYLAIIVSANTLMGLSGSYIVFIMGTLCYTSDATILVPHTRRDVYSYAEATIMTPEVFGPVLTGIWATYYGFFVPLLLSVIISALAICYIAVLPESLPPDAQSRTKSLQLNPLQTFYNLSYLFTHAIDVDQKEHLHSVVVPEPTALSAKPKERSPLPLVGFAFMLFFMAAMGQSVVRVVYVKHRFNWNSSLIGIYDGMEGLVVAMSMVFAPSAIQVVLCRSTPFKLITWLQLGLFFRMLHWGLFGLMPDTIGVFVLLPLLLMVGPMAPYTRTIMSNTVPISEQAKIFSAFSALEGISSLLAPLYSAGYTVFVGIGMPWLVFEAMALACLIGLLVASYVRMSPVLSKHLPEDHHHRHGEETVVVISPLGDVGDLGNAGQSDEEVEKAENSVILVRDNGATQQRVSRRSVSVSSVISLPSEDCTALQYCHLLSHTSVEASATTAATFASSGSSLTDRLLAEVRDNTSDEDH